MMSQRHETRTHTKFRLDEARKHGTLKWERRTLMRGGLGQILYKIGILAKELWEHCQHQSANANANCAIGIARDRSPITVWRLAVEHLAAANPLRALETAVAACRDKGGRGDFFCVC